MPNLSKTFQTFLSHSSVFASEKQPEKLNFQSFLALRKRLVASSTKRVHLLPENM